MDGEETVGKWMLPCNWQSIPQRHEGITYAALNLSSKK